MNDQMNDQLNTKTRKSTPDTGKRNQMKSRKSNTKHPKEFGTMPVVPKSHEQHRQAFNRLALATPELCQRFENLLRLMNDAIEHYGSTGTDGYPDPVTTEFEEFFEPMRTAHFSMTHFRDILLSQVK